MLPPDPRLPEARKLIDDGQYFIVHAPRQAGKTTTLAALARDLSAEGRRVALLFSCESGEVAEDDYGAAELQLLDAMRSASRGRRFPPEWMPPDPWPAAPPGRRIYEGLRDWAVKCPLPLVLFFDEIDALTGKSLRTVLRQLRDGFRFRAQGFPATIALCGVGNLHEYKATSADRERLISASPFNIVDQSLRVRDFTHQDVATLYAQHTEETGQEFAPEAVDRAFAYSRGQPWLVNALAREITFRMEVKPPARITGDHVDAARERLILARSIHLDSLVSKLKQPRVERVIEPLIAGTLPGDEGLTFDDDMSYARDIGLIAVGNPLQVANPIYREVIVRMLGSRTEAVVTDDPRRFVVPDGRLDFRTLLESFAAFWIENGDILANRQNYKEAAAQLVFMAYLHSIVDGTGYVRREYGVGMDRIDIEVRTPYGHQQDQYEGIELRAWREGRPDPLPAGLQQFDGYLDRLGLDTGTLIIFDRRPDAVAIPERTFFLEERSVSGRAITVLRA
jgi:hypothetical protein